MSTSDNHGFDLGTDRETLSAPTRSRYDFVLLFIPAVFLCGLLASLFLSTSIQVALVAASVLSVGVIADVLFLNPPIEGGH